MPDPKDGPKPAGDAGDTGDDTAPATPHTAFVLGGGGMFGGYQVGMLRALLECGIGPDFVVGCSMGAVQGAILAADPGPGAIETLASFWYDALTEQVTAVPVLGLLGNLLRLRPALAGQDELREVLERHVGAATRIEDLAVPFQAAAASIERSTARYFDYGPLVPALLASTCEPGLWPPVRLGDEHYIDGGVVETVPLTRAVAYGAKEIYVLRLRQRELPLTAPRRPWQIGRTVFELSRRHRLGQAVNLRPDGVTVHLLPTGEDLLSPPDTDVHASVDEQLEMFERRVAVGYRSTLDYLEETEDRATALVEPKRRTHEGPWHRIWRGKAAATAADPAPTSHPALFVLAKLGRFFDLLDADQDGWVAEPEHLDAADRVCAAFGHAADSRAALRLREACAEYWAALCHDAGAEPLDGLGRDAYVEALARLTTDPADYDATMRPVIAAILAAADQDRDAVLNPAELHLLLGGLGVAESDVRVASLRLDTNNDGVLSVEELDEAFRAYFTDAEPGSAGNLLFGACGPVETVGTDTGPADRPQVQKPSTETPPRADPPAGAGGVAGTDGSTPSPHRR